MWWKLDVVRAIKKERKRAQKEYKKVPKIIKRKDRKKVAKEVH